MNEDLKATLTHLSSYSTVWLSFNSPVPATVLWHLMAEHNLKPPNCVYFYDPDQPNPALLRFIETLQQHWGFELEFVNARLEANFWAAKRRKKARHWQQALSSWKDDALFHYFLNCLPFSLFHQ